MRKEDQSMIKKYNKKEYLEYIKGLERDKLPKECAIDFKLWKEVQPIADKASGLVNRIIKKED